MVTKTYLPTYLCDSSDSSDSSDQKTFFTIFFSSPIYFFTIFSSSFTKKKISTKTFFSTIKNVHHKFLITKILFSPKTKIFTKTLFHHIFFSHNFFLTHISFHTIFTNSAPRAELVIESPCLSGCLSAPLVQFFPRPLIGPEIT